MKLLVKLKLSCVYLRFCNLFLIVVIDHDDFLMPCSHVHLLFGLERIAVAAKGETLSFLLDVSGHEVVLVRFFVWYLVHLRHAKAFHPWMHHAVRTWGIKWVEEHV